MYKVISFGHRCSSAAFIKLLDLKTESYPFDWLISKLDVIADCIETRFVHFLNQNNYIYKHTETYNLIDDIKYFICEEDIQVNKYYEKNNDKNNNQTYNFKLALNHNNIIKDKEYFKRCINRLYELLKLDIKKYYIYFHPIMGINNYESNKDKILEEFQNFSDFIYKKTTNIYGVYFLLIKHHSEVKSILLKETKDYIIYIIYCNDKFLDGGGPFEGENAEEKEEVLKILKNIFI